MTNHPEAALKALHMKGDFYGNGYTLPKLHDDPALNQEIQIQALCSRLDTARVALAAAAAMQVVQPALAKVKDNAAWAMRETDPCRFAPKSAVGEAAPDSSQGEPVAWRHRVTVGSGNNAFDCWRYWDREHSEREREQNMIPLYATPPPSSPQVAVADHVPAKGPEMHGYCVQCGRPWPCPVAAQHRHQAGDPHLTREDWRAAIKRFLGTPEIPIGSATPDRIEQWAIENAAAPQSAPKAAEPQCPFVETSREGTSYCRLNGPPQDAKGEPQWQPIETLQRNVAVALLCADRFMSDDVIGQRKDIGYLTDGRWFSTVGEHRAMAWGTYSHWSPIPRDATVEELADRIAAVLADGVEHES